MSRRIRLSLASLGLVVVFASASPAFAYDPRVTIKDLEAAGYTPMAGGGYTNGHLTWDCSKGTLCKPVR